MLPLGLIASGIGAIAKLVKGAHQNNLANNVSIPEASYNMSPYAQNTLDLSKQMFNSRMPGTEIAERGIMANNANTNAGIQRNATSSSQALAMMAAAQGQTDQSFQNLGMQEGQYKLNAFNNLSNANAGMTEENARVYQDAVRKQQMAISEKNALRGASTANIGGGMNDLINNAWMYSMMKKPKSEKEPRPLGEVAGMWDAAQPLPYRF